MTITIPPVILDPVVLLLRNPDERFVLHPFDSIWLEGVLNRTLAKTENPDEGVEFLRLVAPDQTGRWSLAWKFQDDEEETVWRADRHTQRPGQVRAALPPAVVRRLRALSTMSLHPEPDSWK